MHSPRTELMHVILP